MLQGEHPRTRWDRWPADRHQQDALEAVCPEFGGCHSRLGRSAGHAGGMFPLHRPPAGRYGGEREALRSGQRTRISTSLKPCRTGTIDYSPTNSSLHRGSPDRGSGFGFVATPGVAPVFRQPSGPVALASESKPQRCSKIATPSIRPPLASLATVVGIIAAIGLLGRYCRRATIIGQ